VGINLKCIDEHGAQEWQMIQRLTILRDLPLTKLNICKNVSVCFIPVEPLSVLLNVFSVKQEYNFVGCIQDGDTSEFPITALSTKQFSSHSTAGASMFVNFF
jgi:hypothetical protein